MRMRRCRFHECSQRDEERPARPSDVQARKARAKFCVWRVHSEDPKQEGNGSSNALDGEGTSFGSPYRVFEGATAVLRSRDNFAGERLKRAERDEPDAPLASTMRQKPGETRVFRICELNISTYSYLEDCTYCSHASFNPNVLERVDSCPHPCAQGGFSFSRNTPTVEELLHGNCVFAHEQVRVCVKPSQILCEERTKEGWGQGKRHFE